MKKYLGLLFLGVFAFYLSLCGYYYLNQEKMIFAPIKLPKDFTYEFDNSFEELFLTTKDKIQLNALYFKKEENKGVVYYLHGKSGNLKSWGTKAKTYLDLGYNVFLIDYRGFGKSQGKINSEEEFYNDVQLGYDYLKQEYKESQITVIGFSLGSGAATKVAAQNNPKELILLAPYFQVDEKFKKDKFYLPKLLCKYEFPINQFISDVKSPITIFYGEADLIIDTAEVKNLKSDFKQNDKLIELERQGHNQIEKNKEFLSYFED